ncbi:MAG: rRNA maturation RNase YbeY [Candidatus Omnitrophota bacterium]
MEVEVIKIIKKRIPLPLSKIRVYTFKVLKLLKIKTGSINIVLADDAFIRKLNRQFLKRDYPTDVLAFREVEGKNKKNYSLSGEIVISLDTAKRFAKEYGKRIEDEVCLYLIHGLLHLMGYDDRTLKERKKMEELQDSIFYKIKQDEK